MKRWRSILLSTTLIFSLPLGAYAQSIELQAISDFTNLDSGEVPYYLDIAGGRNVLAINAADPAYREKFARAEHEYTGSDGIFDITINALGEIDGDGTYRLIVNGVIQGESVNDPVSHDYVVIEHTFQGIALTTLDTIAVESNAVSNDTIPEGDGFAFARGRWRSVSLDVHDPSEVVVDTSADLGLSLSTIDSIAQPGGQAPFIVSVINNSEVTTATGPVVEFSLPDEITFYNSEDCAATQTGVRCLLPNLAPAEIASVSFIADINASGWLSLSASVSADQPDNERTNNAANLSFESGAVASPVDTTETVTETETENETETGTGAGTDTQTQLQTGAQTDTQTETQTESQTETQTEPTSPTNSNTNSAGSNNPETSFGNNENNAEPENASSASAATPAAADNNKSGVAGIPVLLALLLFSLCRRRRLPGV